MYDVFIAQVLCAVYANFKNYFNFMPSSLLMKKEDILKIGDSASIAVMNTTPTVQQVLWEGGIDNVIDDEEGK